MPRSYQVTPAGPSHLMPTKLMNANPKMATTLRARHQVIRIQPPQHAAPHPDTDNLLVDVLDGAVCRRGGSTSAPIQIRRGTAIHRLGSMNIGQRVYLY
jgi:hypothetical protein